jgi:acyl-CoA hydrolase
MGAGVVTTRAHVRFIVTEHGVADLYGKTINERVRALIKISAPAHRENLEKEAFEILKLH